MRNFGSKPTVNREKKGGHVDQHICEYNIYIHLLYVIYSSAAYVNICAFIYSYIVHFDFTFNTTTHKHMECVVLKLNRAQSERGVITAFA